MSGNDIVRLWKDPDRDGSAHPSGDITLDGLNGGIELPINHITVVTVAEMRCPPLLSHLVPLCPPTSCHTMYCPLAA